ncbi:MAG: 5-methyltetrahydropteroyltriglutamate--homocysteine S-methyltransferase [Actinomycetia bacterium]|nr:5-methyltetrahydropteroyltriglutamate--homocysteine S-methyltransferase [Actinomycetes bacterium]MCP4086877.1 5-methyltetrahydropteroyltriglutamate--homocysteine S-methyltransferase [Actinomycetes bacterium]
MGNSTTSTPPFRAEHVGSLLRPRPLKEAARAREAGELAHADYVAVLDAQVERVVTLQENVGLEVVTDGEFGRNSWFGFFFARLQGFSLAESLFEFRDADDNRYSWPTAYADAPMRRTGGICTEELARLQRIVAGSGRGCVPKANMPSPSALHFFRGDECRDPAVYPDIDGWWSDVTDIYRAEIEALGAMGCTYLQLDEVPLAMLCDPDIQDRVRARGTDPDQLIATYIERFNEAVSSRPDAMTVGMHLCRGNFRSRWMASGGYGPVAERLFNGLDVDAFFLEYDSERAGDFSPLDHMPADKHVVLGLVSSKSPELEAQDALRNRIDEAAQHMSMDHLCLSPQCGFASVAGGNLLTEDQEIAKLDLVVRTAELAWG